MRMQKELSKCFKPDLSKSKKSLNASRMSLSKSRRDMQETFTDSSYLNKSQTFDSMNNFRRRSYV